MSERKIIIEYRTIWVNRQTIDESVNDAINTGWQPLGGISHIWEEESLSYSFCQAMVKYE